nr:MAG TPA: hypothetical protein [Crassvirales sp.]
MIRNYSSFIYHFLYIIRAKLPIRIYIVITLIIFQI